jgi:hypothetical protein
MGDQLMECVLFAEVYERTIEQSLSCIVLEMGTFFAKMLMEALNS